MENVHSTDGIAEDLIRSFTQLAVTEMHCKTLLEKRFSELDNGLINIDDNETIKNHLSKIDDIHEMLSNLASARRSDMLMLYKMYGENGDKEQWCLVKHLAISSMTAFECFQAVNNESEFYGELLENALNKNKMFINSLSKFIGVEITECASCFADILKAKKENK